MARPSGDSLTGQWIPILDEFTRQNRGAHLTIEILGNEEVTRLVETENRPFFGISADGRDGEDTVWVHFSGDGPGRYTHAVVQVRNIEVKENAVQIESADGTKTILHLTSRESFALPQPAENP